MAEVDDEIEPISPFGWFITATITGAIAVLLAVTSFWEEEIAGYTARRRAGFVNFIESVGQTTWIILFAVVALFCLTMGIRSVLNLRRTSPNNTDNDK